MSLIAWTDALKVGNSMIDADHEHFIELLNAVPGTDAAGLPALFAAILTHAEEHFAREEDLMRATGFFAYDHHKNEHGRVLTELRRFQAQLAKGNAAFARAYLLEQVPAWFIQHRNTMDAATAAFAAQAA